MSQPTSEKICSIFSILKRASQCNTDNLKVPFSVYLFTVFFNKIYLFTKICSSCHLSNPSTQSCFFVRLRISNNAHRFDFQIPIFNIISQKPSRR